MGFEFIWLNFQLYFCVLLCLCQICDYICLEGYCASFLIIFYFYAHLYVEYQRTKKKSKVELNPIEVILLSYKRFCDLIYPVSSFFCYQIIDSIIFYTEAIMLELLKVIFIHYKSSGIYRFNIVLDVVAISLLLIPSTCYKHEWYSTCA